MTNRLKNTVLINLFVIFVAFIMGYNNVNAEVIKKMPSTRGVSINKEWSIKFNTYIDERTVNDKNIMIVDIKNNKVDVDIKVGQDKKSIIVKPKQNLVNGKTYYLVIKEGIKTRSGKNLSKETSKEFTITRQFPKQPQGIDNTDNRLTIAIDPGQLWNEYIVGKSGVKAADVNLNVALKVGQLLKEKGIDVVYTRNSSKVSWTRQNDEYNRIKISESKKTDIHLIINTNAYVKENVNGIETYYLENNSDDQELAKQIQKQLISYTAASDRGIKTIQKEKAPILEESKATAVQIELGFITNTKEEQLLLNDTYQRKLAKAIVKGIENFVGYSNGNENENKITIKNIDPINVEIKQDDKYVLPTKISATMSDGSIANISVKWNNSIVNTNKTGTFKYEGSINGYENTAVLNLKIEPKEEPKKVYKVTINPSRGGFDNGIIGVTGAKEKDINLDVALKLGKILESKGVQVIYTRKSDYVPWNASNEIAERVKISNNAKSDLMISIGGNAFSTESSNGIENYYLSGNSEGKELAQYVQNELIKETGAKYREIKGVNHLNTLKLSNAVSIWAAIGFLTNKQEESYLKREDYRQRCAEAIADGVMKYIAANPDGPVQGLNQIEDKVYFDDIVQNIKVGQSYNLPQSVNIKLENGTRKNVKVTWYNTKINTNVPGLYRYEGKIQESNKLVSLVLIINEAGNSRFKVGIDPGHGGYDPGGIGITDLMEKNVVLPISLKVGDYLIKNGVDVVYTRTSDKVSWPSSESADLKARTNIANNANVDLFVSVHANKNYSRSVHGIETYYYRYSTPGKRVAEIIQNELVKETGAYNRGAKGAGFYVIKYSDSPAVLLELGFLSNAEEERKLATDAYQTKCAKAIARGILKSLGIYTMIGD